ncbi:MAG: alpha-glucoside ABC transporter substrate-binding protein, partial [Roseibium sp.]
MILRFGTYTAAAALAVGLTSMSAQADLLFKPGEDPRFNWESYEALKANDLSGKTVTVFGPWLGPDKELVENTMAYFEEATGIDVQYSGSDSFEQQIV